jgi:hypothetical protein
MSRTIELPDAVHAALEEAARAKRENGGGLDCGPPAMPGRYWDTSALVKHYHPEVGSPQVDALLQEPEPTHVLSRLAVTEMFSVFAGKARAGLITGPEFTKLCRRFLADTKASEAGVCGETRQTWGTSLGTGLRGAGFQPAR